MSLFWWISKTIVLFVSKHFIKMEIIVELCDHWASCFACWCTIALAEALGLISHHAGKCTLVEKGFKFKFIAGCKTYGFFAILFKLYIFLAKLPLSILFHISNKLSLFKAQLFLRNWLFCCNNDIKSVTLQQRGYRTATLPLKCNCCILCVRVNLKVILNFNHYLYFFLCPILLLGAVFSFCDCF